MVRRLHVARAGQRKRTVTPGRIVFLRRFYTKWQPAQSHSMVRLSRNFRRHPEGAPGGSGRLNPRVLSAWKNYQQVDGEDVICVISQPLSCAAI